MKCSYAQNDCLLWKFIQVWVVLEMIRVLIVDDSALMRKHLTGLLESAGDFTTRAVRNGAEALAVLEEDEFDVVTLDINMPVMDGLTCLSRIMATNPKPVVMVSSLTQEGAEATLEALNLGAVDYVQKPDGTISLSIDKIERELVTKIRMASRARIRRSLGLTNRIINTHKRIETSTKRASIPTPTRGPDRHGRAGLVLVGVSTGGPGTLEQILPYLEKGFPWPVLIAQHMPGSFTGVFARRLNGICQMPVVEVERQMPIEPSTIYIAKGDADLIVTRRGTGYSATPVPASRDHLWHPSVERMVQSALDIFPADRLIGVQLTGMGDDGASAMAQIQKRGGLTIAQNEDTCVVFGMPNELIKRGGASIVLPSHKIAGQLNTWLNARGERMGERSYVS
ncbi:chemotaxis-specific protein-glutamate methyltransferase CheB [Asticcacaulis benevestitus]|nr:chemotaxis-specific protein-glutamate methyltransferase CheB [Asticcacaulis benevestitus]